MNLRIAPEYLRFRISEDEFFQLESCAPLSGFTRITETLCFEYTLRVDKSTHPQGKSLLDLATYIRPHAIRYILTVFSVSMDQLKSDLGCKDGIREFVTFSNGDILTVGLDVDLHSKQSASKT